MRGRFAPSPTGNLHLGNLRTALLAWLQARSMGGVFVLRVEDLDRGRVRDEYRTSQLDDLRWLGLDWDEGPDVGGEFGPYLQSEREDRYREALELLARRGLLYECHCTRKEIAEAASAPHADDAEGPAYPGTCRDRPSIDPNRSSALRFRTPAGNVTFHDEVHGTVTFNPAFEVGDFVVRRKDGVAAYQLAVVVDDDGMRISHVLRGSDLLSSTARQIQLYHALDLAPPQWTHVPLMLEAEGDRIAKRHGALTVRQLRENGFGPERLVGWLASTCGLLSREREVSPVDLIGDYDPARIPRVDTPVVYPDWLTRAMNQAG